MARGFSDCIGVSKVIIYTLCIYIHGYNEWMIVILRKKMLHLKKNPVTIENRGESNPIY